MMRRRAFWLFVVVVVAFAAISLRLADIQIFSARRYGSYTRGQETRVTVLPGVRGALLDRNGRALALSEQVPAVVADPYQITDPAAEAAVLAPMLGQPAAKIASELGLHTGYVQLASSVPSSTATALDKRALPGIVTQMHTQRYYPAGPLARPVLGAVDSAGKGASGLELAYDKTLAGRPGRIVQEVDPQGQTVVGGTLEDLPAQRGDDVVLTLDEPLQYQTEQALGQALVASHAKSGMALVMDTHTGGILAVANLSLPGATGSRPPALPVSIGPGGQILAAGARSKTAQPVESSAAAAFTHVYEPGSVEKLVTVSAALATGAISANQVFDVPAVYPVDGIPLHDAEKHGNERLSVTGIVAQSSNIGAVEIAQRVGAKNLYHYISSYGIGQRTPVGFPGESAGLIPPLQTLTPIEMATMAYGEGMAVTAAQMVGAYNTVANGGVYVAPHLIEGVIGAHGREHLTAQPPPRRVVSATIAHEMTGMFEQVVAAGTGQNAAVAPYAVAGKTGTAQYDGPHGYVTGYTNASFAGYAPAQKPAVTVIVVIEDTPDYGAQAAAPAFSTITRDALEDLSVAPDGPQPPASSSAVPLTSALPASSAG